MNNKPVAWAIKADNSFTEIGFDDDLLEEIEQMYVMEGWKYDVIPLYTHPVKELKNIVLASATCSCGKVMELTNLQPAKELTINITEIKRTSDQSIQIVFTSCRSASEFVEILRKSQKQ